MTRKKALETLNLPQNASRSEIRHAYSQLCKIYHVETHPEKFQLIHEAYKIALKGNPSVTSENVYNPPPLNQHRNDNPTHSVNTAQFHDTTYHDLNSYDFDSYDLNPDDNAVFTTRYDNLIDSLLIDSLMENNLAIEDCQEITQLIYYKYYYDLMLNSLNNTEKKIVVPSAMPADEQLFFGISWRNWKQINWTTLICHPQFIRNQYNYSFLNELYQLFHYAQPLEIDEKQYYVLYLVYGNLSTANHISSPALTDIENILQTHEHQIYRKQLERSGKLNGLHHLLYQLFQWAVNYSDHGCKNTTDIQFSEQEFLDTIEKELIQYAQYTKFQNHIMLQWLSDLPGEFFSKTLMAKIQYYKSFDEEKRKCAEDFQTLVLDYQKDNSPFLENYQTLDSRIRLFKERYLQREDWKKLIVCSTFFDTITDWMKQQNPTGIPPALLPYDTWKILRTWFQDFSTLGNYATYWLTHKYYFPEYVQRQNAETAWRVNNAHTEHYKKIFPLPELTQGRLELLQVIKQGIDINSHSNTNSSLMHHLFQKVKLYTPSAQTFLSRITDAMIHFKFLLFAPKQNQDSAYGDAFCFLKDHVILYYEKENLTCTISHQAFYDIISDRIDYMAYQYSINPKAPAYTNEFIHTVCKNLYYYDCYVHPLTV